MLSHNMGAKVAPDLQFLPKTIANLTRRRIVPLPRSSVSSRQWVKFFLQDLG